MALTSQITTSLLQVDGRMTEGGVIEIVPGARLLLDVGVEDIEPGALLDEIAAAVAEAKAARDEAVDISGISTSDAVIASRITTPGTATETALSATYGARFSSVANLLASTQPALGAGKTWWTGPYVYAEAASGASDHHVTTAGGVKLYVLPIAGEVHLSAFGVTAATTDVGPALTKASTVGPVKLPPATTLKLLTTATLSNDLIGTGGSVIDRRMDAGTALVLLDGKRMFDVEFTASIHPGPVNATDGAEATSKYNYGARGIDLSAGSHVERITVDGGAAGLHPTGPRVTGRKLIIRNVRQRQGFGAALHMDSSSTVYCHFSDLFIENCDRASEIEKASSHNLVELFLFQGIGPVSYTGQPVDFADYAFICDVHSHVGEGACQRNVYRHGRIYNSQGAITCLRSDGSNDSDLPRNNLWLDIEIAGRVGTTGFDSVQVQGHNNEVHVRMLPGAGITSRQRVLIADAGSSNHVVIEEATGYALPLGKIGTSAAGRNNKITARGIRANPTVGTDWLFDVNHPDSLLDVDVQNVTGTVGYARLGANAKNSAILATYSVASGTSMTQAWRVSGAKNARVNVQGTALASGVLDLYVTTSTVGLVAEVLVDRTSGVAVNFDNTTTRCKLSKTSNLGAGTTTNAGVGVGVEANDMAA